jgi:hypothetical protein
MNSGANLVYVFGRYPEYVNKVKNEISAMNSLGWGLTNNLDSANVVLSLDQIKPDDSAWGLDSIKILLRQEPFLVAPENYSIKNLAEFNLVLSVGGNKEVGKYHLDWPQNFTTTPISKFERITDRQVLINSNLISLYKGENYSLRRQAVFELNSVDLYGYGWDKELSAKIKEFAIQLVRFLKYPRSINSGCLKYYFQRPENYFGPVSNKNDALSKYKISIIIENCNDYVSEKIFDSFLAGTIPVYVGPDLNQFGIPQNLYFRADQSIKGIKRAVQIATNHDYSEWKSSLDTWLGNESTKKKWDSSYFVLNIQKVVDAFITNNNHPPH